MAFIPKDGTGNLFINKKKSAPNHPDRQGSAMINGEEYEISGWIKQKDGGDPYLSMTIKRKSDSPKGDGGQQRERRTEPDFF